MNNKIGSSEILSEAWSKLSSKWNDDNSVRFYNTYILKMGEELDDIEKTSLSISTLSSDMIKKLQLLEHKADIK